MRIGIEGTRWTIDGAPTYRGSRAEGLLMNVRMVNAVFEDRNRTELDPDANTDRFIRRIGEYVAHGIRAFTLCLQGGFPGYEGALNSAFAADGSLRPEYMDRVARAIAACDEAGAAVILGCYYQRQSAILRDADAVRAGVRNAARWVAAGGFRNVVLEVANEYDHPGFGHEIIRNPDGQAELIALAREAAPGLLVSTSGLGHGRLADAVARAADVLLIHYNSTPTEEVPDRIAALRPYGVPIVCNEDVKVREEGARVADISVREGASWGLMAEGINQHYPFRFGGRADDPIVYDRLRELTTPRA